MKKKNLRPILQGILCFFPCFFFFLSLVGAVGYKVSSVSYAKTIMEESHYRDEALAMIEEELASIAIPSGFPEDFFSYGINTKPLDENLEAYVESAYRKEPYTVDVSAFNEEIREKIFAYANEVTPGYSEETRQHLEEMVSICTDVYRTGVASSSLRYVGNYISALNRPAKLAAIGFAVFGFIALCCMGNPFKNGRYYAWSALGLAGMLIAFPVYLLHSGMIANLDLGEGPFKDFIVMFLSRPLEWLLAAGLAVLTVALIGIGIGGIAWAVRHRRQTAVPGNLKTSQI